MTDESENFELLEMLQEALRKPVEEYFARIYDELTRQSLYIHADEELTIGLLPVEPADVYDRFGLAGSKQIRRPLYEALVEVRDYIDHQEPNQSRVLILLNELLRTFDDWRANNVSRATARDTN